MALPPSLSDQPEPDHDRWKCTSDADAEWAMRKAAEATRRISEHRRDRDDWVAEIEDWFDRATKPLHDDLEFFESHLAIYALAQREAGVGATVDLPSGRVETRKRQPHHRLTADEDTVIAWLDEHGVGNDIAPRRRSINLVELRRRAEYVEAPARIVDSATGEVYDFVGVTAGHLQYGESLIFRLDELPDADDDTVTVAAIDGQPIPGVTIDRPEPSVTVKPTII